MVSFDFLQTPLQTPQSGYHGNRPPSLASLIRNNRRFFEGWYYRITLPEVGQNFAFMYSIEDPHRDSPYQGGGAQILGPDDAYFCRTFPNVNHFWADRDRLGLGHWGKRWGKRADATPHPRYLAPDRFDQEIQEGYQATAYWHQGKLTDPRYPTQAQGQIAWQYTIQPRYGWGSPRSPQRATPGWLSYLELYEPGWQVLMAQGWATGWVHWRGQRYDFTQAPAYSEKNWGSAFPQKWFWLNCNCFKEEPAQNGYLAFTAAGGQQYTFDRLEAAGLIGVHYQGQFYNFALSNAKVDWQVAPWGSWWMQAETRYHKVMLSGTTSHPGSLLRAPTQQGLAFCCRETLLGQIQLELQEGSKTLVKATSSLCALETGGGPWETVWEDSVEPRSRGGVFGLIC